MKEVGSSSRPYGSCEITISGTKEEIDGIRSMLRGALWLRNTESGVTAVEAFSPLPAPENDPFVAEHWQRRPDPPQRHMVDWTPTDGWHSPGYFVSHLCGYGWSLEAYTKQCELLRSYGFCCMRSKRDEDGGFWEVWYLPFELAAKGELGEFIKSLPRDMDWNTRSKKIVAFLCQNASFGMLDVTIQRAAMVNE